MTDLINELSGMDVFAHFPTEVLARLAEYSLSKKLIEGEHLCRQGEVWPYVFFLGEGQLNWSMVSSGGKEHQLFKVKCGQAFWAHSIFDDQPMPASLSAGGQVLVYIWARDIILPLLMKYPKAMWDIPKILTGTMRSAREIIYGLAFQPVASRLAGYILDNFESSGQDSFTRDITLEEIATVLATSAEVVCRLLYQFQTDGILKITRTQISLEDQRALEKLRTLS
jgi:CRP/FNR family cyclic AMP-dependent transcriptional regulator